MEQQIFKKEYVYVVDDVFQDKKTFFKFLTNILVNEGIIKAENQNNVINEYLSREAQGSTGFESGFAIPHCRTSFAVKPALLIIKLNNPMDWQAMDKKPTDKLFCIIVPSSNAAGNLHMEILSNVAVGIMDNNLSHLLNVSQDANEIFAAVNDQIFKPKTESDQADEKTISAQPQPTIEYKKKVLVVSACTYGLAHTYMAEKKALDYGKEHNYFVKVETHGSRGDLNILTDDEMKTADAIILAVDKPMDLSRIKGKNIIRVRTIDLIKNPEKCFNQALNEGTKKISNLEKAKNLFKITAYQKLFFGSSRGWNYVGWASMVVGVLAYILQVSPSFHPTDINSILVIIALAATLAPCMFVSYVAYSLTKNNSPIFFLTLFMTTGLSFFQKFYHFDFNNFSSQEWSNNPTIGIIGSATLTICIVLIHLAITKIQSAIPKKVFIKEYIAWAVEIVVYFLILFIFYKWIINPMSIGNNAIYNWWTSMDDNHWWFRFIFSFIFFELMVLDLGGPANKWALVFSAILFFDSFAWNPTNPYLTPFTATCLAVPIPCLGLGIRGFILKNKLSDSEKAKSLNALKSHFKGISEAALFALEDYKWRGYLANLLTSIVAAILIAVFHLEFWGGFNNLFGIIFSFSRCTIVPYGNIAFTIVTIGSIVASALFNTILLTPIKHNESKA